MKELRGACIIGQSGGPTSVINASAYGVIDTALKSGAITQVLGAEHGIMGVLNDRLFDMGQEDPEELRLLKYTPSSALGSCRYKIADPELDDTDYKRILEVFKKHDVRYFFYNGGNDSMDTCNKINQYMQSVGYECRVMGVPKTIDNDLFGTDHCPGYASAAKYIATSIMEVYQDAHVYDKGMIVVVEIMGRHAGWLAAASALASEYGAGPDLIYLPETDFSMPKFIEDVKKVYNATGNCIVAVSEGIHYEDGGFVSEAKVAANDGFGHAQLGGLAATMSLWETDAFAAVFSLCGSFWYPGVADFIEEHVPKNHSAQVYLQNGIREGEGHNNRLCDAYSYAQRVHTALQATCGAKTVLDDYGHHDRQSERLNAALRWVERVL